MIFETDTIAARAWEKETLTALAEYVVETHHAVTRDAIVALPMLAAKARGRHGEAHPETGRIEDLVRRLVEDLAPHLAKEEQILFPYVAALEASASSGKTPDCCFGTVRNPIRMMMREHDAVAEILSELRVVTKSYVPPADACASTQALYSGLRALETDLHRHIHLENDILFPRALALEEGRSRP